MATPQGGSRTTHPARPEPALDGHRPVRRSPRERALTVHRGTSERAPGRSLVMVLADGERFSPLAGCQIVDVDSAVLARDPRLALATGRVRQQWGIGASLSAAARNAAGSA